MFSQFFNIYIDSTTVLYFLILTFYFLHLSTITFYWKTSWITSTAHAACFLTALAPLSSDRARFLAAYSSTSVVTILFGWSVLSVSGKAWRVIGDVFLPWRNHSSM